MRRNLKLWAVDALFLAFMLLLAPFSASAGTLEDIRSSGVLRWGSDAEGGAPYVFPDPEHPQRLIGFEVDLADAIAKELGVTARQAQNDWSTLLPALNRGDFDIALNGIEWTGERSREVAFSRPYYIFSQQLTVRANETAIRSLEDLRGRRAATLGGTAAQAIMEKTGGVDIRIFQGQVEPYTDLALGRVDAVLLDLPIAVYYAQTNPALKSAGPPFGEGSYAIALRKNDSALKMEIDRAIGRLIDSGKLRSIYERWGLWNDNQTKLAQEAPAPSREILPQRENGGLTAYLPLLLKGAGMTVVISTLSMALAVSLGLVLTLMRRSGNRPLRWAATLYIEIIRGTPLLLQLYMVYFGLPGVGIQLSAFSAAVIALGMNYAAYEAEIYRAGLDAVHPGQAEAATVLGMDPFMIYRRILIPQAARIVLPPSTNDFIALFKDSSLVSIIAIVELTKAYNMLAVSSLKYLELGALTAILYLMMSYPLARLSRRLERRFQTA